MKDNQGHTEHSYPGYVLDFCISLGRGMIESGANLERVSLAIERICHVYGLRDVSIFMLTNYLSLGARDEAGVYSSRQVSIRSAGIHLQRLKQLNRLSYSVAATRPEPWTLSGLLERAMWVEEYRDWMILIAQMCAMSCLCLIFGGGAGEVAAAALVTALMHYLMLLLAKPGLDNTVVNAVVMFVSSSAAILLVMAGLARQEAVVLITISMMVIPGIPLVNAVRNLLCGNEMNGILQIAKLTIETLALAVGIFLALYIFGQRISLGQTAVTPMSNPYLLILLSFLASLSFGVVFRIHPKNLLLGSLGGVLTRIALILLTPLVPARVLRFALSALVAALYAEFMATVKKTPSTYYIYPAIIPLIPGDLFFYAIMGLDFGLVEQFTANGINCLLTLLGMSIGFVASSIIAHYVRRTRHTKLIESMLGK